ncbi:MAG TPA: PAS domain S-box protein, partial [Caldithrix abyssi]|nr:PAS domain S-box protein [Caldithrix abyssi]
MNRIKGNLFFVLGIAAVAVAVVLLTFFYFSFLAGKIWLLFSLALILTGLVLLLLHQKRILRDQLVLSREMAQWEGRGDGLSAARPLVLQELFASFRKMVARLSRRMLSGEEKLLQTEQALDKEIKIHKSLEQALQKSETIFQQLWQISADGMRLTDADGTILQVNNAFCEMVGLPREELIGQPFSVVYQEAIQEEMLTAYRQHFVNNQIMPHQDGERRLWNGRTVWFAFSNSFLELHDSGRLLLSIIKDITLRKKAELELKESERRFRLLFNHANDAIFVNPLVDEYKLGAFIEV